MAAGEERTGTSRQPHSADAHQEQLSSRKERAPQHIDEGVDHRALACKDDENSTQSYQNRQSAHPLTGGPLPAAGGDGGSLFRPRKRLSVAGSRCWKAGSRCWRQGSRLWTEGSRSGNRTKLAGSSFSTEGNGSAALTLSGAPTDHIYHVYKRKSPNTRSRPFNFVSVKTRCIYAAKVS